MRRIIYNPLILLILWLTAPIFTFAEPVSPTTNQTCPELSVPPTRFIIPAEVSSAVIVEEDRWVRDENTKLIVKEFFRTPDTLYNFLKLVYTHIEDAVNLYKQQYSLEEDALTVLFKGGNVLRMVAKTLFDRVSPEARDLLVQKYDPFITRSDADFSIIIDFNKLNGLDYEKVRQDIGTIAFDTLEKLRGEFEKNPTKYFNFLQLKDEVASAKLGEYLDQLNKADPLKDEHSKWSNAQFQQLQLLNYRANPNLSCDFLGAFDFTYAAAKEGKEREIIGTVINAKRNWITNSLNRTLQFIKGAQKERNIQFDLIRSKVAFEVTFNLSNVLPQRKVFAGELIDISVPHKADSKLPGFLKNLNHEIAEYTLKFKEADDSFKFKSESIEGLVNDLSVVIFAQSRPWEDAKYLKRLNRLFLLSVIEMLSTHGLGSEKGAAYIKEVKENLIVPIESLYPLDSKNATLGKEIVEAATNLEQSYPELSQNNKLFMQIAEVINKLVTAPEDKDEENFPDFLDVINDNIDMIEKLMKMAPMKVDEASIYDIKMESLL